eukprot:453306_1
MMLWIKSTPALPMQGQHNLNVQLMFNSMANIRCVTFQYSNLQRFAVIAPFLMVITLLWGLVIMLMLSGDAKANFLLSETISAVANSGGAYPSFIVMNTLLAIYLTFIGIVRFIQIHHQILHVNIASTSKIHMHRMNKSTMVFGIVSVISTIATAVIRIKVSFLIHITFAEVCFWSMQLYQFVHVIITWKLARHCYLHPAQAKYFQINVDDRNNGPKPLSNRTIALLSWFIGCFVLALACNIAFCYEQTGFRWEENQFGRESNILEWMGIALGFLYFLGYPFLFYYHPIKGMHVNNDNTLKLSEI